MTDSPVIVSTGAPPPAGTLTYPYTGYGSAVASGSSPPFTWEGDAGRSATGSHARRRRLANNGTPTAAGAPLSFTVTATDSAQPPASGSQPFTVTISTPGPPVLHPGPNATRGCPWHGLLISTFGETGGGSCRSPLQ